MVQAEWALRKVRFNNSICDCRHFSVLWNQESYSVPTNLWLGGPHIGVNGKPHSSIPISQCPLNTNCYRSCWHLNTESSTW